MPVRIHHTPLSAALALALALPAYAQEASPPAAQEETTTLDRISVTGSRIKRAEVEGPAPVVVVTAEEIRKQGFSTVWESLGTLAQFTGSAFNETDQTGSSPNGQYINLRGLGPGYQLILLNGKRLAEYAQSYGSNGNAVSLGSIPAAAIERIEVMSGGASAIYGSDAVAGVINIITKTNFSGDSLRLRAGTTTRGGGDNYQAQWVGGRSGEAGSVTYAFEHLQRDSIVASQRDFMDSYFDHPANRADPASPNSSLEGVALFQGSGNRQWLGADGTLSGSFDALQHACNATNPDFVPYKNSDSQPQPNRCGAFDYYEARSVQNGYEKTSAYVAGTLSLSDSTEFYGQVLVSKSDDSSSSQTHYYVGETPFRVHDPELGLITAQRVFLPDEVGGIKQITYDEEAWNLNLGMRGTILDNRFDWDASLALSRNSIVTSRPRFVTNYIRDYYMGPVLGYTDAGDEIRQFYVERLFAPGTPELYDQLTTQVVSSGMSQASQAQVVFSGDLFTLPAGAVQVAAVLEAAEQDYNLTPDPRATEDYTGYDKVYNLTQTPGGGPRDRYAAGLEFRVPILESLTATLAGRYDKYDDITSVDDAVTWQAGLEWRPLSNLLVRGTRATSFRAPDLLWIYAGTTSNNPFITDEYLCRSNGLDPLSTECEDAYNYQSYSTQSSNPGLEEETGKSTTFGFVWDVMEGLSLSVDYYDIELEGRVETVSSETLLENNANCLLGVDRNGQSVDTNSAACQFYIESVTRNISVLNPEGRVNSFRTFPINQASMRTKGVDASLSWRHDAGNWGVFGVQAGWSHVLEMEVAQFADAEPEDVMDDVDYVSFRTRSNWRLNWEYGDWNTSVYGYRYGTRPNYAEDDRIDAFVVWNAEVNWKVTPKMTFGIGVLNAFDKIHPADDTYTAWPYFPRVYSGVGRQVFATFNYDF